MEYFETYKGYQIGVERDEDVSNPFDEYIDNPAISDHAEHNGGIECPMLTRKQILDNVSALLELTGSGSLREMIEHYYYDGNAVEAVNDWISENMPSERHYGGRVDNSARIDYLRTLLDIAGIDYGYAYKHGYYQGDVAECLVLDNPKDPAFNTTTLDNIAAEYAQWRIGDVYGVIVNKLSNDDDEPEYIDGCWGIYGEESALEYGKDMVDSMVSHARA